MMKKTVCLLVALGMLFCGLSAQAAESSSALQSSTFAEVLNTLGISLFAPGEAEDAAWSVINEKIAQLTFTLDGVSYSLRASGASAADDISGMNFTEGEDETVDVVGCTGGFRSQEGVGSRILWYDALNGVAFSLGCQDKVIEKDAMVSEASEAYRYCMQGTLVSLEADQGENYVWEAMGNDAEKTIVSQPVNESGAYTFAIAPLSASIEDTVTFVYYDPAQGLESATKQCTYQVVVDSNFFASLEEQAAG